MTLPRLSDGLNLFSSHRSPRRFVCDRLSFFMERRIRFVVVFDFFIVVIGIGQWVRPQAVQQAPPWALQTDTVASSPAAAGKVVAPPPPFAVNPPSQSAPALKRDKQPFVPPEPKTWVRPVKVGEVGHNRDALLVSLSIFSLFARVVFVSALSFVYGAFSFVPDNQTSCLENPQPNAITSGATCAVGINE
jgi:hypothetical protein